MLHEELGLEPQLYLTHHQEQLELKLMIQWAFGSRLVPAPVTAGTAHRTERFLKIVLLLF